jgi:outer membrane protein OmpA-like peptidoglycan-associated protein
MRNLFPPFVVLTLTLTGSQAAAQVTVNPNALDQLNPAPKAPAHTTAKPPAKTPPHHPAATAHTPPPAAHHPVAAAAKPQAPPPPPPPPAPFVPVAPPPAPVIPAPVAVPMRPAPPPPPPVLSADAPDAAVMLPEGLRITFGADRSDLSPPINDALKTFLQSTAKPGVTYTILSYAAGTPDDASIARRLSLARALTIRSVLINAGLASERIYVKALGSAVPATADGPADRADIVINPSPQNAAEAPSAPKPATP